MILLFSMCHSLHVAVNKCINWCYVYLYLLFYYSNKVFMLMVNYKPSAFHGMKTLNLKYFGVTILIFMGHVTSSVTWSLNLAYVVSYWWSIVTMHLSCTATEILARKILGSRAWPFGVMTIGLGVGTFLLVVHWNHASIFHRYGDIKPQSCICPC